MFPNNSRPPLNPTVEEASDETESSNGGKPTMQRPHTQLSWSDICSQHESVLSSHVTMLQHVKEEVSSDPDALRALSMMLDRTNKLVTQFESIKKHIIQRAQTQNTGVTAKATTSDSKRPRSDATPPSQNDDVVTRLKHRKKRHRLSNDQMQMETESSEPVLVEAQRVRKRKRVDVAIPGGDEDARNTMPVSVETEDISDEVQRRLKIKEDQRRRRNAKPEKRKRDSLASNGSTSSPGGGMKPRKKFKLGQVNR